jgi:NAD(P) transhydrogenase subunit alpha
MNDLTVGVLRERAAGERRVALTPDAVGRLQAIGLTVIVEAGAGAGAWFPDSAYAAAGARVSAAQELYGHCDLLICVHPPDQTSLLRAGQAVIGLLQLLTSPQLAWDLAAAKVTAISLDGLPRTLSRAQAMDVLTSQANVAGYKAALVAADAYGSYFPMLMTAAGTVRPATVLVIGAGVAGLQAIGTARRLGAIVTGYDVRPAARADVLSTGAAFLDLGPDVSAAGGGGYARELTEAERRAQQDAMTAAVSRFDVVITTAQVPGRRPPVLISAAALAAMDPGSVVVDLAASPLGGNVEGAAPDSADVTGNGVTVIGAGNLPAAVPRAASAAYARNICALLAHLIRDGRLSLDTADEITAGVLVTRDGEIVHPGLLAQLATIAQGDSR